MELTPEQKKMLEAINIAIEMESDGQECYLAASRESKNDAGRQLLVSLAQEEDGHKRKFQELYESIAKGQGWPVHLTGSGIIKDIRSNLGKACQVLGVSVDGSSGELEALETAIVKEKKSYEFYKQQADKAVYDTEKKFYSAIASEEWEHEQALLDYHEYLSDPAGWFADKEHPSLDGG